MGRECNDGRGRMGGRGPGVGNKKKPLKGLLEQHSLEYFSKTIVVTADMGLPYAEGTLISQFDANLALMKPAERVDAEIKLLNYHLAKMQATSVDISATSADLSIEQRLADLCRDDGQDNE